MPAPSRSDRTYPCLATVPVCLVQKALVPNRGLLFCAAASQPATGSECMHGNRITPLSRPKAMARRVYQPVGDECVARRMFNVTDIYNAYKYRASAAPSLIGEIGRRHGLARANERLGQNRKTASISRPYRPGGSPTRWPWRLARPPLIGKKRPSSALPAAVITEHQKQPQQSPRLPLAPAELLSRQTPRR